MILALASIIKSDAARGVIYDHHMFIVQAEATDQNTGVNISLLVGFASL